MTRFTTSRPDHWTNPRGKDARHMTHGKIMPMEHPGLLQRMMNWMMR